MRTAPAQFNEVQWTDGSRLCANRGSGADRQPPLNLPGEHKEAKDFLARNPAVQHVVFVCFGKNTCEIYSHAVREIFG
jgi:hypothetical protein